jgi:hypothetical protein
MERAQVTILTNRCQSWPPGPFCPSSRPDDITVISSRLDHCGQSLGSGPIRPQRWIEGRAMAHTQAKPASQPVRAQTKMAQHFNSTYCNRDGLVFLSPILTKSIEAQGLVDLHERGH